MRKKNYHNRNYTHVYMSKKYHNNRFFILWFEAIKAEPLRYLVLYVVNAVMNIGY